VFAGFGQETCSGPSNSVTVSNLNPTGRGGSGSDSVTVMSDSERRSVNGLGPVIRPGGGRGRPESPTSYDGSAGPPASLSRDSLAAD
jgi:hypothetical protein